MKRPYFLLILIVVVLVAAGLSLSPRAQPRTHALAQPPPSVSSLPSPPNAPQATPAASPFATASRASRSAPSENQKLLARLLREFIKPERSLSELIHYLRATRQEPLLFRDKNEFTGELSILRTRAPLPGTRYFHAQYFSDEGTAPFLQHMSFEFPGKEPGAWPEALTTIQTAFPGLGAPLSSRTNFVEWDVGDGYTLWMKRLDPEDLKDHPFNAYSASDVGAIRVAIELNPEAI